MGFMKQSPNRMIGMLAACLVILSVLGISTKQGASDSIPSISDPALNEGSLDYEYLSDYLNALRHQSLPPAWNEEEVPGGGCTGGDSSQSPDQ